MNEDEQALAAKKVRYTASIIYLLVFAFIVGGSYINQQQSISTTSQTEEAIDIIWPEPNNSK